MVAGFGNYDGPRGVVRKQTDFNAVVGVDRGRLNKVLKQVGVLSKARVRLYLVCYGIPSYKRGS